MEWSARTKEIVAKLGKKRSRLKMTIGVFKHGKAKYYACDGRGNEIDDVTMRYDIGSITKTVSASILAEQILHGKCELTNPLNKHISGLPAQYYPSLQQLATHNSGYGFLPFSKLTVIKMLLTVDGKKGLMNQNPYHNRFDKHEIQQVLAKFPRKDKEYPFSYSNFGFGVLGYIEGLLAGDSYWTVANNYLKDDLKLSNMAMGSSRTLQGCNRKNVLCPNWQWTKTDQVAAAGALSSDITDLLRYGVINMQEQRPAFLLCHQKHAAGNKKWDMGLGWRLDRDNPYIWHDGGSGAFSAFIGFDKQHETAVAVLTNYGLIDMHAMGFTLLNDAKI